MRDEQGASGASWSAAPGGRIRQAGSIAAIILGVAAMGWVLAPESPSDSAAILGVETDVAPETDDTAAIATPSPTDDPVVARSEAPQESSSTPEARPSPTEMPGEWIEMPDLPLAAQSGHVSVWTGSELVVWGGQYSPAESARMAFSADGAAYEQSSAAWRPLADSPLAPRAHAAAVWTGSEVFIWGGAHAQGFESDGAAYSAASDSWRPLAGSPLSPRAGAAAIWTGTEIIVVGGHDNAGPLGDGAAYDPARDAWTLLEDLPAELARMWSLRQTQTSEFAIVWGDPLGARSSVRYVVESGEWEKIPAAGLVDQHTVSLASSGDDLYAAVEGHSSGRLGVVKLAKGMGVWERLPDPPRREAWGTTALWTDRGLALLTNSDSHWVFEDGQRWSRLPRAPRVAPEPGAAVWTGQEILMWKEPFPGTSHRQITAFRFTGTDGE